MLEQAIVVREPKSTLPEDFRKKLLDAYPIALGYAVPQDNERIDFELFDGGEVELEAAINEVEKHYSDDRVFYYAVNAGDGELNWHSIQPFELLSNDKEGDARRSVLMAMVVGEFPEFVGLNEDGEEFTDAYHMTNRFLMPLVDELWDLAGQDIERLMALLEKKTQKDKIAAKLGPKATVLFIPCKGVASTVMSGTEGKAFKGFYTTNTLGYEEEKPITGKGAVSGKLSLKARAEKKTEEEKEGEPEKTDEKKELKPEEILALLTKAGTHNFALVNNVLYAKPPKNSPWKEAKQWWNNHSVLERPDDAKVYAGFPAITGLKPTSPIRAFMANVTGPATAESEQGPAQPDKKIAEGDKPDKGEITLFIPADQKKRYLEMKKSGMFPISSREKLKETISEYPLASIQLGENYNDLALMNPAGYNRLPGHIKTILWHETRLRLLGLIDEKAEETKVATANADKKPLSLKDRALRKTG